MQKRRNGPRARAVTILNVPTITTETELALAVVTDLGAISALIVKNQVMFGLGARVTHQALASSATRSVLLEPSSPAHARIWVEGRSLATTPADQTQLVLLANIAILLLRSMVIARVARPVTI